MIFIRYGTGWDGMIAIRYRKKERIENERRESKVII